MFVSVRLVCVDNEKLCFGTWAFRIIVEGCELTMLLILLHPLTIYVWVKILVVKMFIELAEGSFNGLIEMLEVGLLHVCY